MFSLLNYYLLHVFNFQKLNIYLSSIDNHKLKIRSLFIEARIVITNFHRASIYDSIEIRIYHSGKEWLHQCGTNILKKSFLAIPIFFLTVVKL